MMHIFSRTECYKVRNIPVRLSFCFDYFLFHLFGIYKTSLFLCRFVWRDENVPIFLCASDILKNWIKMTISKMKDVSLRNLVFNECQMWMYAQSDIKKTNNYFSIGSSLVQKMHENMVVTYFKILLNIFLHNIFQL